MLEHLKTNGRLSTKRLESLKTVNEDYNKSFILISSMAESLGSSMDMSEFALKSAETCDEILMQLWKEITGDVKENLFEDEETRAFYEDFANLEMYVKRIDKKETEKSEEKMAEEKLKLEALRKHLGIYDQTEEPPKEKLSGISLLLSDLGNANNKAKIDSIAERFCALNNLDAQIQLMGKILKVRKDKLGQILFYCRLIATLSKFFKDFEKRIVEVLEKQFYGMFFAKDKVFS
ncbi:mRNA decay protein, partial [Bonamia ostreae]